MIEFEERSNLHALYGNSVFGQMITEKLPKFSSSFYHFTFKDNKAVYLLDHKDAKSRTPWDDNYADDNITYSDYTTNTFTDTKFIFDNTYLLSDSLLKMKWKMVPHETRNIAGFNCRKAYTILFDSVYVFAFYTDEIMISGGPLGIHGLPGMILGITIPRMHTSWIATKLQINGVDTSIIKPPKKGKMKDYEELKAMVEKMANDRGSYFQRVIWGFLL